MAATRRRVRTDLSTKWVDIFTFAGVALGQVGKVGDDWAFVLEPGVQYLQAEELREIAGEIDAMRNSSDV